MYLQYTYDRRITCNGNAKTPTTLRGPTCFFFAAAPKNNHREHITSIVFTSLWSCTFVCVGIARDISYTSELSCQEWDINGTNKYTRELVGEVNGISSGLHTWVVVGEGGGAQPHDLPWNPRRTSLLTLAPITWRCSWRRRRWRSWWKWRLVRMVERGLVMMGEEALVRMVER